ncbi:hypothetical protein CKJ55_25380 [Mycobacterium avium]|nr:hypothetical protein [Mycobacterium avium]PBA63832.1 hypothetical protein CKJ55_25380 [Mycobacterium avium]PBA81055.1 hypothetical protein CKJ71_25380 [Mycobacterium avium]
MFVFRATLANFEVGFYRPDGKFEVVCEKKELEQARNEVNFLNGGVKQTLLDEVATYLSRIAEGVTKLAV